ncbi:MAG: hypothetical protein O4806_14185 [Trichodesmium sp. St5_bin8]|nr:hypothetical protein [Trichodesmium sp. MAG_R01]MDE5072937.1 hypothetical protein [Trichodesmium sp. St5_bin8]
MPTCPKYESSKTLKNDHIHNSKYQFKYSKCGRQFVENPTQKLIDQAIPKLIHRLLLERISLAGIPRVV